MKSSIIIAMIVFLEPISAQDPVQVAPNNYKVMFENERVRVLSFHARPGEKWPLHVHPDAVTISLSE